MKKGFFILVVVLMLLIIQGLLSSIFTLWNKQDVLTSAKQELQREELQNKNLKNRLSYVQSNQFVEEEAHNKLFLAKPGQQEVLISPDLIAKDQTQAKIENIPNWQRWINLFFY